MTPGDHFDAQRAWFRRYMRTTLEEAEPITAESVGVVELLLMEAEVDAARCALERLGAPEASSSPSFVRQVGTTCMSTSVANGMISLGEPFLLAESERRVGLLTSDIVARTSAFGKPGEYRSVDDMFKYLEGGRLLEVADAGETFASDYTVRLTCSLLDVCEALWTGRGRLVVQRAAHAYLGFGIAREGSAFGVRLRDPMWATGPGEGFLSLARLRQDYLWSPLKKIPRLMGPHAFPQLSADELIGHLDRYAGMDDLGVECPSAILYRKDEAPPRTGDEEERAG